MKKHQQQEAHSFALFAGITDHSIWFDRLYNLVELSGTRNA